MHVSPRMNRSDHARDASMNNSYDRRSIRLPGYDYSQPGVYLVTICTRERACLFGRVAHDEVMLSPAGEIAGECWNSLPAHFPRVEAGPYVVMPNHVHGVVIIADDTKRAEAHPDTVEPRPVTALEDTDCVRPVRVGARHASPVQPRGCEGASLGAIVASYKSAVTRLIHERLSGWREQVWQRGYYDHVVRDQTDFDRICM